MASACAYFELRMRGQPLFRQCDPHRSPKQAVTSHPRPRSSATTPFWSVALGVIFWWMTWKSLALPPLDNGLLGTYFVSAATFLGLKLPEPTVPTA